MNRGLAPFDAEKAINQAFQNEPQIGQPERWGIQPCP